MGQPPHHLAHRGEPLAVYALFLHRRDHPRRYYALSAIIKAELYPTEVRALGVFAAFRDLERSPPCTVIALPEPPAPVSPARLPGPALWAIVTVGVLV